MKLFNTLTILLILVLFALPVMAQDGESLPPEQLALLPIPPLLLGLIAANNRATEAFKLYLQSPNLPYTPASSLRSFLVLLASVVIGIALAWVTPNSTEWLGADFAAYPLAAILVTGVSVSAGGAIMQIVLSLLASFKKAQA